MPNGAFDFQNPTQYFRIAFASVRRNAEKKGLVFSFDRLEDLASQTLVRFYELHTRKKLDSGYAIPEIARYIVLEASRDIDPTAPLLFDDLLPSPLPSIDTAWHDTALNCLFRTLSPTERKIADAFLEAGGHDPGRIAEIAGTTPANVSKYLNKMRSRVGRALALFADEAAIAILADDRSYIYEKALYSFAQSSQHHGELSIRVGTALTHRIYASLSSYQNEPSRECPCGIHSSRLFTHTILALSRLLDGFSILKDTPRTSIDPSLLQLLSTELRTNYDLTFRFPQRNLRTRIRDETNKLNSLAESLSLDLNSPSLNR